MATDQRQKLAEQQAALDAELAELDSHITENLDGTLIVRLVCPVGEGEQRVERVTVRRANVGDVRACRGAPDAPGQYALRLVKPEGVIDRLEAEVDYEAILRAVDRVLGKYRSAGRRS